MRHHSSDSSAPSSGRVGRRAVVRTGVWTVPAVTLAVAAPAMAVSAAKGRLSFNNFTLFGADYNRAGHPTSLETQLKVENDYVPGGPTLSTLTVTLSYPDTKFNGAAPTHVTGSGWSFGAASHLGSVWLYSFIYTGTLTSNPSLSTSTLDYRVPLASVPGGAISLSAVATGAHVTSATASGSVTLS